MRVWINARVSTADMDQGPRNPASPASGVRSPGPGCRRGIRGPGAGHGSSGTNRVAAAAGGCEQAESGPCPRLAHRPGLPVGPGCGDEPRAAPGVGRRPAKLLGAVAGHHLPLRRGPVLHHGGVRSARAGHPLRARPGWDGSGPATGEAREPAARCERRVGRGPTAQDQRSDLSPRSSPPPRGQPIHGLSVVCAARRRGERSCIRYLISGSGKSVCGRAH